MAENRVGRQVNKVCGNPSPCRAGGGRDPGQSPQRRRALVTVTYNRDELQRRLEVDRPRDGRKQKKGISYTTTMIQEEDMPEEVNIDELLDLKTDEERTHRLQITLRGRRPRESQASWRRLALLPGKASVPRAARSDPELDKQQEMDEF
uniref:Uncharacterized protein n=1 Tax=Oreochromis aureus TaxID=47969 RepID=A0AAZ1XCW5_OREAU